MALLHHSLPHPPKINPPQVARLPVVDGSLKSLRLAPGAKEKLGLALEGMNEVQLSHVRLLHTYILC